MGELLLLGAHGLASAAFVFAAGSLLGASLTSAEAEWVVGPFVLFQLVAAIAIAAAARKSMQLPAAVLSLAAAGWSLWCAIVATMALTGNWL